MNLTSHEPTIMYSRPNPNNFPLDYEPFQGEIVPLKEADFSQADQISQRWGQSLEAVRPQWAIYLHALALRAFQHWFDQRTTPTPLDISQAFILSPDIFEPTQRCTKGHIAVCQINVAPFKLCLVVTDGSSDDWCIPKAAIQNPNFAAHFYLPIVIYEESGQAEILGFLRHDQLPKVSAEADYCQLTIDQVNPDLERLLLYITCLDPIAIPLPAVNPVPLAQRLRQLLVQPVVRTGQWLGQQVDAAADQLGEAISNELAAWQLLPTIELAAATRSGLRDVEADSPMGDLSSILMSLMRGGMQMPIEQATAYQDLQLGNLGLRLYVVIAPQPISPEQAPNEAATSEWSLLIILRRQDRTDLPQGVELQIADADSVLVNSITETNQSDFLYGTVIGEVNEMFTVRLNYQDQSLELPPLTFE